MGTKADNGGKLGQAVCILRHNSLANSPASVSRPCALKRRISWSPGAAKCIPAVARAYVNGRWQQASHKALGAGGRSNPTPGALYKQRWQCRLGSNSNLTSLSQGRQRSPPTAAKPHKGHGERSIRRILSRIEYIFIPKTLILPQRRTPSLFL